MLIRLRTGSGPADRHPTIEKVLDREQAYYGHAYFVMPLYRETLATQLWGTNLHNPSQTNGL